MRLRHVSSLAFAFVLVALAACGINGSTENTTPPTSSGYPLTLGTDHSQYAGSEVINATITNHLSTAVYALDTRASCSVLSLQILMIGQWQDTSAAPCAIKRVAMPVKINVGATYAATIRAGFTDKSTATFPAGTYRFVLIYYATPNDHTGGMTVYSAQFTIMSSASAGSSSGPSAPAPSGSGPAHP